MDERIDILLDHLEKAHGGKIQRGARHFMEVNLAGYARKLGYADLEEKYKNAYAVIPLKVPQHGIKVCIDGRTFVNYAEYDSGLAVPGYIATAFSRAFRAFVPADSMICDAC